MSQNQTDAESQNDIKIHQLSQMVDANRRPGGSIWKNTEPVSII